MFNNYAVNAPHTTNVAASPASGIIIKLHEKSVIKIVRYDSHILESGYTVKRAVWEGMERKYIFHEDDKCTVLQVMPYTERYLLVEYVLDKDIDKEQNEIIVD